MNSNAPSIEQQAIISQINGNVQLMRDGFLLPAQPGQMLLPGDRLLSAANAKATVQFTGVQDVLVIEQGSATTFNLEVLENEQYPQWVASEISGEGVFFESQSPVGMNDASDAGISALFGNASSNAEKTESTGYPILESIAGLAVTAAIFSDNENESMDMTAVPATGSVESGSNTPPGGQNPEPMAPTPGPSNPPAATPEPAPQNPLGALLEPVLGVLSLGAPTPLGSQSLSNQQTPSVLDAFNLNQPS